MENYFYIKGEFAGKIVSVEFKDGELESDTYEMINLIKSSYKNSSYLPPNLFIPEEGLVNAAFAYQFLLDRIFGEVIETTYNAPPIPKLEPGEK
ncbi:hypothetical protein M0910_002536 [Listeria monocytogenes]|uniref:hypothetical protein n=1 Tax=Listeria ivanovii TaxID=1638 RepID=UPI001904909F|nr:hypothetical protein [Listeria ivanovii]EHH5516358.1 hypothetical protein [Listeria monocytogenes]EJA0855070.1 hypothetical protein [Listeria monocytogenes]EJA0931492.1 hypothetical protein [Listeria monocytogenes]EJA1052988.1 hypothetical protein [Listeria monocytogenes]EJA1073695.1 hypothetical protein [Listeria monocytogenes]